MEQKVCTIFIDDEIDDLRLLVLVNVLGQNVGTLSVGLAPLLGLRVVELQAYNTLSELRHHVDPKHCGHFCLRNFEDVVHFRESSEPEATGISSALFVRGRDILKSLIPGFAFLVARLEFFSSFGVSELCSFSLSCSVNKLSASMTKELVASNVDLIALCDV